MMEDEITPAATRRRRWWTSHERNKVFCCVSCSCFINKIAHLRLDFARLLSFSAFPDSNPSWQRSRNYCRIKNAPSSHARRSKGTRHYLNDSSVKNGRSTRADEMTKKTLSKALQRNLLRLSCREEEKLRNRFALANNGSDGDEGMMMNNFRPPEVASNEKRAKTSYFSREKTFPCQTASRMLHIRLLALKKKVNDLKRVRNSLVSLMRPRRK